MQITYLEGHGKSLFGNMKSYFEKKNKQTRISAKTRVYY